MRQFGCVELTQVDALLLRDAIRPLTKVDPYETRTMLRFCEKLYGAILKMKAHDLESICMPLEEPEVFFLNHFVSNDDWGNALKILEQSWLVLHELRNQDVYPRAEAMSESIKRITKGATSE